MRFSSETVVAVLLRRTMIPVLLGAGILPVRADTIIFHNGTTISGVVVVDLRRSDIQFRHAGQLRHQALADIRALYLDALPDLRRAEELIAREQYQQAISRLDEARRSAAGWQKQWIDFRLIHALDRAGRFVEAVDKYLSLMTQFPLEAERCRPKRPTDFSSDDALRLRDRISSVRSTIGSQVARDALDALLLTIEENTPVSASSSDSRKPQAAAPSSLPAATSRAFDNAAPDRNAPLQGVAPLLVKARIALRNKRYDDAAQAVDQALQFATSETLPEAYFLKGRQLLEQARDQKDILRAGWWFARVPASFDKNDLAGESLYYLADVHQRLGQTEIALTLLRECRDARSLSPETRRKVLEMLDQLKQPDQATPRDTLDKSDTERR